MRVLALGMALGMALAPVPANAQPASPEPTAKPGEQPADPQQPQAAGEASEQPDPQLESEPEPQPQPEPEPETEPEPEPEEAAAAELYFQGRVAYDTAKYDEAIGLFEQAYQVCTQQDACHAPALQYNLAQAYWKRGEVNGALADLRQARTLFKTYDQVMRDSDAGHDSREVKNILSALDAKIEYLELAERAKAQGQTQVGPTAQEMRLQRRLKTTKALHGSGTALIVTGSIVGLLGVAGLIARYSTGFMLDQSGGGEAGSANQNSPEDDRKLRDSYAATGKLAFGSLLAAGIILPVGITLKIAGKVRDKDDGTLQKEVDDARDLRNRPVAVSIGNTLLRVEF